MPPLRKGDRPAVPELNHELAYAARLPGGPIASNALVRPDPGDIRTMREDFGGALHFTRGF